ncbi:MAG TPA: PAS domain-containing sensor histidine kinase [Alphaproteobacteria bacterium]|jgi:PAS domain S-box-containing protein|nr:PAS domain-containing sensor histidine kinase [Alphaproteobacteria bacterium]
MSIEQAKKIALASIESQPSSVTKLPPRGRLRPAIPDPATAPEPAEPAPAPAKTPASKPAAKAPAELPLEPPPPAHKPAGKPANDPIADPAEKLKRELAERDAKIGALNGKIDDLGRALRETQSLYRASRQRFHDFILSTSDWLWETDAAGRITFVSERITELLGRPARLLKGQHLFDLGTLADTGHGPTLLDAMRARHPFRDLPMEFRTADGQMRRGMLSGMPVFEDETGRFLGYRGTGADVTLRHEAETTAKRTQARLEYILEEAKAKNANLEIAVANAEAASLAKTEFLANVSHELRTPLNAIIGFSEIMQRELFGQLGHRNYREYTDAIVLSARHLLEVISDLLEMSRAEAGQLTIEEGGVDVAEAVAACRQLLGETAKDKKLALAATLPPKLPHLWADRRLVRQMLLNLVSNSIKFTPEGGTITIEARQIADGRFILAVSDTGIGIDPKNFAKVLSPFGQVESAMSRSHEGTGLGLPLVKGMMERHGGTLELQSELGQGTTVTLYFPRDRVMAEDTKAAE